MVHLTLLLLASLLQPAPQQGTAGVTWQRPSPGGATPELREPFVRAASVAALAMAAMDGDGGELRDPFDATVAAPRGSAAAAPRTLRATALERGANVPTQATMAPRAVEAAPMPARRVASVEPTAAAPADLRDPFRRAAARR